MSLRHKPVLGLRVVLVAGLTVLVVASVAAPAARLNMRAAEEIRVSPNILVDHDFDAPHGESLLAINPRDDKNLVDASMTYARTDEGTYIKTYASHDGGYTWDDAAPLGDRGLIRSFDPLVAFGPSGTAYLVLLRDESGSSLMEVYRSTDGGLAWHRSARLRGGDHEQLAVDMSHGRFRGRIYITIPQGRDGNMYLYRSDDDAKTFAPRRVIAPGRPPGNKAYNPFAESAGLVVLNDGTLVAGIARWTGYNSGDPNATLAMHFTSIASTDGGDSFGPERTIADAPYGPRKRVFGEAARDMTTNLSWPAQLAADSSGGRYANRLYAAWPAFVGGHARIDVGYSPNRGDSWRTSAQVGIGTEKGDGNDHAALAVNRRGVVGIAFHHTPANGNRKSSDLYFSASTDGGQTWVAPVRVSSQTSFTEVPGNLRPVAQVSSRNAHGLRVRYFNALGEEPVGGDYMGLVSDTSGAFQALWPDSRSGAFHLYTAKIALTRLRLPRAPTAARSINSEVTLVFDPSTFDAKSGDYMLPIRLKNVSQETILGPVTVRLAQRPDARFRQFNPLGSFAVLNATNNVRGVGAALDYTTALGGSGELPPGAVTDAVTWRIHLGSPAALVFATLTFDVRGHVQSP